MKYVDVFGDFKYGVVKYDESLSSYTTFKIGGKADCFIFVDSIDCLKAALMRIREYGLDYYVIGNGSNILFSDEGYRGVILYISKSFSDIRLNGNTIVAQAGVLMSNIAKFALKNSLSGFEFASGIPGTIGGGVIMNSGAYGGELVDVVRKVVFLDENLNETEYDNTQMKFGYRQSALKNTDSIVLSVEIELEKGNADEIRKRIDELTVKRTTKQPLSLPSAGSTFKRPQGDFAARLIETTGLKGLRHGGACVSEKHAGFVVNDKGASAKDVYELIKTIQKLVYDKSGVLLEPELIMVGNFKAV